jgi:hypothetical protein
MSLEFMRRDQLYRVQRYTADSGGKEENCDKWLEGAFYLKSIDLFPPRFVA